jgi:hypothetical protein
MPDEIEKPRDSAAKQILKAIVLLIVIVLGIIVVGFGLLVGVCFIGSRR